MICATIHGPTLFDAKRQLNYASDYADMAEFRMDLWANHRKEDVEKLVKEHPDIPMIFVLRPHPKISELKRLEEIEKLAQLYPKYFEIEQEVPEEIQRSLVRKFTRTQWIVAKNMLTWSQEAITTLYERHKRELPHILLKVTVKVKSSLEALQLCLWVYQQKDEHLIGVAEGIKGQISQLLSPVIGNPWTYAGSDPKHEIPGVLLAETLRQTYRIKKSRELSQFLVHFGNLFDSPPQTPSAENYSYLSHNTVLEELNEPAVFVGLETDHLEESWRLLKELPMRGASVGRPYQEELMTYLDYTDPTALKVGAVNTIVVEEEFSYGFNNLGFSVLDAIEQQGQVSGKSIGILGAESTARAVAFETLQRGGKVTVYSRNSGDAKRIAYELGCSESPWEKWGEHTIWINTVTEGVQPPEILKIPLKKGQIVLDLAISPIETPFLEKARASGAIGIAGSVVFVQETSGQFCLWFKDRVTNSR